jgi:DNA-directed RNA polymerase beta subunit
MRTHEVLQDKETGKRKYLTKEEYLIKGKDFINEYVLPHIGYGEVGDNRVKAYHVGYMVNRLVSAYVGKIPCDDRDHLENKRFDLAGPLMATLLKKYASTFL